MKFGMNPAPFVRAKHSTQKIMLLLTAALAVVWAASIVYYFTIGANYGVKAIMMVVTAIITTVISDVLVALLRSSGKVVVAKDATFGQVLKAYLKYCGRYIVKSYSYVTAIILALTLPIGTPLYVVFVGSVVATVIGKHLFGGFGGNVVNPAAVGRIFVGLSFADKLVPYISDSSIGGIVNGSTVTQILKSGYNWLINSSTTIADLFNGKLPVGNLWELFLGTYNGAIGETFTLLILILAVVLVIVNVIDWRFPVFYMGTVALCAFTVALANGLNPVEYTLIHLSVGGLAFGAVFMLTDPVTTPTTRYGTIIASIVAGFLTFVIRIQGGYPEGVIYSIALVNIITPLIDKSIKGMTISHLGRRWGVVGGFVATSMLVSLALSYPYNPISTSTSTDSSSSIPGGITMVADLTGAYLEDMVFTVTTDGGVGDEIELEVNINLKDSKVTKVTVKSSTEGTEGEALLASSDFADKYIKLTSGALTFAELNAFTFETTDPSESVNAEFDALIATSPKTGKAVVLALKAAIAKPTELGYKTSNLPVYEFVNTETTGDVKTVEMKVLSSYHNASDGEACGEGHDEPCSDYILKVSVNVVDKTVTKVEIVQHSETPGFGGKILTPGSEFSKTFIEFTNPISIDELNAYKFFTTTTGRNAVAADDISTIKTLADGATRTAKSTVLALRAAASYAIKGGN
jgi:electron transport complex protein RnfD